MDFETGGLIQAKDKEKQGRSNPEFYPITEFAAIADRDWETRKTTG